MKKFNYIKSRAFTLIEMLIVISIIGILITISMTSFASAQRRSRDTTRKAQVLNISSALERYRSANNVYAPDYCAVRGTPNCGTVYGAGLCEGLISNDLIDTPEPAFDVDSSSPARTKASGFLLPFIGKPRTLTSTINQDQVGDDICTFSGSSSLYPLKTGRIRMSIHRDQYWINVVLENKNDKRSPAGTKCWSRLGTDKATYYTGTFIAYTADVCGSTESDEYKLFARGSRGEPSPN